MTSPDRAARAEQACAELAADYETRLRPPDHGA
jgi:hypothetical protein